ncbi:hypothetical protein QUB60_29620 [Microcoleus sp. A2-C5]|uniref:hypothetical protein n=1 Tax=unclassified Microcoleus TaxID=2642155 RepID=UPI002FD3C3FC
MYLHLVLEDKYPHTDRPFYTNRSHTRYPVKLPQSFENTIAHHNTPIDRHYSPSSHAPNNSQNSTRRPKLPRPQQFPQQQSAHK